MLSRRLRSPDLFFLFLFRGFARATGWRGRKMITYASYSTAGLASEGGAARTHQRHRNKRRLASTKDHFLLNCSPCWEESRRGGTPPIFSLFDQPSRRSLFLGTPSVRTCPKASPVSVAHSPSRSRCFSQTSNPGFPKKSPSPPSLHIIATPTKSNSD